MSTTTKKRLKKLLLQGAHGLVRSIELVILDAATPKRIRRSRR